ncbi:hypothetical protein, conserved [Plasmodium gonderi]|uniref:Uncharacterized protein n=1 Tax=Plasmodium gonderi TaxID=77519 RepID=A0A1Y1JJX8_PLAGO|nr:hypothetical protein, conserved [Plasmodium gonderi]GAW80354.1 hypothetical protein, conserved [Plasmodium gonderi]
MGNYLGFKENKYNKSNIKTFEKRYGYNLNELHSYVYKINLPLKPRYVSYVLEGKTKKKNDSPENVLISSREEGRNGETSNVVERVATAEVANVENEVDDSSWVSPTEERVDIYNQYDRENLNNSNNIYKNKLIIKDKRDNEKYEDMYVHMIYNKKYVYDGHKNNIYEYDNISNYISKKHTRFMDEKNRNVKKMYANLCLNYYNNLDTCVIKKYHKNVQNRKYKFTRLHTCKPHYVLFARCIKYRDRKLMNEIKKVEFNYYNSLDRGNRSLYLNEFITNLSYHEYLISKMNDGVEKIKVKKELNELRERYNHILRYAEVGSKGISNFDKSEGKTHINKKKHVLLNI